MVTLALFQIHRFKNIENMHSSEMVETAMATSGLLYKDEAHRGKEARTYLRSSSHFFFATIINRVFTDEVV